MFSENLKKSILFANVEAYRGVSEGRANGVETSDWI
jgi:hypothetical protein